MSVFNQLKDRVSAYLHFAGLALSVAGLSVLVTLAVRYATGWHIVAFSVYGASLVLLYAASSFYHLLHISDRVRGVLRKLDHMMIYVLIAGTYTPMCLIPLRGPWGWALFGVIWGAALGGMILNAITLKVPRVISTLLYIAMGWAAIVAVVPLWRALSPGALLWLLAGGAFYTIGGALYAVKRPRFKNKWFGFHELFHIFVLLGSICHFILILVYLI